MQIILYTTTSCPFCKDVEVFFKERKLNYTKKQVDIDNFAKQEMVASSGGFMGVPFTVFIKDDGKKETVIGFDKGKLEQLTNQI